MFDCQKFLEEVYVKAFIPEARRDDLVVDGKPSIQVGTTGSINPVTGNIFGQEVSKVVFPLITWVQAGSSFEETIDNIRDTVEFDISISVKRPHVFPSKMEPEPPLSRLLNAAETALIAMVSQNALIELAAAETDENTINRVRYTRAFTLTVKGPVAHDGPLTPEDFDEEDGDYKKLFP